MQFKYCPQCGNMDFKQGPNGPICLKCSYNGPLNEGPMDKINELRKRSRNMASVPPKANAATPGPSMKELQDRLKALKGKSTEDAEFL